MIGSALAEFQISLTFANAPIDRFARGDLGAMTSTQKHGALRFFGKAQCINCHSVRGTSDEMFSDFENHVLGVRPRPSRTRVLGLLSPLTSVAYRLP
jgi:cytochrome c peroxidase